MMNEFGERRPHVVVSRGADAEAEVDIIECDSQVFVETADLIEDASPHKQARRRHRADVLNGRQPFEVTGIVMLRETMGMTGEPVETEHNAPMLDTPIRIDELRADA